MSNFIKTFIRKLSCVASLAIVLGSVNAYEVSRQNLLNMNSMFQNRINKFEGVRAALPASAPQELRDKINGKIGYDRFISGPLAFIIDQLGDRNAIDTAEVQGMFRDLENLNSLKEAVSSTFEKTRYNMWLSRENSMADDVELDDNDALPDEDRVAIDEAKMVLKKCTYDIDILEEFNKLVQSL